MKNALAVTSASLLLIVGALPVLAYPFILLIGAMSFDAGSRGFMHTAVFYALSVYPAVYMVFLVAAIQAMRKGAHDRARSWASYPAILALLIALAASAY